MFLTDYICHSCDHEWEVLLTNKDEKIENCPKCSSANIARVPGGNLHWCNNIEHRNKILKKRSNEHSLKQLKKIAGHKGSLPQSFGQEEKIV